MKKNRFDYLIIIFIVSLIFGLLGGALQVPRLLGAIFLPLLLTNINFLCQNRKVKNLLKFYIFFYAYCLISVVWTPDKIIAFKEFLYFTTEISYFLEIILFSMKANKPFQSILKGWYIFILLTFPIALVEIFADVHFGVSAFDSEAMVNIGGGIIAQKRFASVTFGNYNTYATVLCLGTPFILLKMLHRQIIIKELLNYIAILILLYIVITIASRGALLALAIIFFMFIYYKRKLKLTSNKVISFILFFAVMAGIFYYGNEIFDQVINRMLKSEMKDEALFEDTGRINIIFAAIEASVNSLLVGHGIGSMLPILTEYKASIPAAHNLLLEILLQYGLIITLYFIVFILNIYLRGKYCNDLRMKFFIYSIIFSLPIISVINSGYLHMLVTWAFLSSLFSITYTIKWPVNYD